MQAPLWGNHNEGDSQMRRKWQLGLVFSMLLAMFGSIFSICYAQGVVIPYAPEGWTLDGVLSDGEFEVSAELLSGAMPIHAYALHDGEALYLAFETFEAPDGGTWDEIFTVFENGDGALYSEGDHLIRCFPDGCEHWRYVAQYQFVYFSDLPWASSGNIMETTFPLETESVDDGWAFTVSEGEMLTGFISDNAELGPWSTTYGLDWPPEPATEAPEPTSTEPPVVVAGQTEVPEPTPIPVEGVEDDTAATPSRLPGWLLPGIGGGLLLALLLGLYFGVFRKKPKKLTPCEEYEKSLENLPDGWRRAAKVDVENGRSPSMDPNKAKEGKLRDGIEDMKKLPPSDERDKAMKELEREIEDLKYASFQSTEVPDSSGAKMSLTTVGIPENVPTKSEWFVDTKDKGYAGEKIGEGKEAELSPEQLDDYAENSPAPGVVKVIVKITICPGTPQERTIWSSTMQITQVPPLIWEYGPQMSGKG
jgi:hypothetical protein